jgi:hypothetical protein
VKRFAYALGFVVFAACGGGGSSVSIVGDPPAEQAAEVADAICDQLVECGEATIDCTFNQETQMQECVGTIEDGPPHDECVAEYEPGLLNDFENCDLTAEEEAIAEDCINALLAQPCISQSELDDYVAEIEAGNEPEPLRDYPEVCVQADAIFEACSTPA